MQSPPHLRWVHMIKEWRLRPPCLCFQVFLTCLFATQCVCTHVVWCRFGSFFIIIKIDVIQQGRVHLYKIIQKVIHKKGRNRGWGQKQISGSSHSSKPLYLSLLKIFLPFLPMHICWVSLFMPSSFVPTIQYEEKEKACVGFTVEQNSEFSGSFIIYQTWWCWSFLPFFLTMQVAGS